MKTVIFTGGKAGPLDTSRHWLDGADTVIAADSGLDLCRNWGYEPDLLCGDFDSVARLSDVESFPEDKVVRHVEAKAWSDTELALHESALRSGNPAVTVLVGGNGGRTDHLFSLLQLYRHDTYPTIWLGDEQAIICLESNTELHVTSLSPEDKISCFALRIEGGQPGGNTNAWEGQGWRASLENEHDVKKSEPISLAHYHISSDALLWPLQDVQWETGAESLSNWLKPGAASLELKVTYGRFLVFVPLHAQAEYQVIDKVHESGDK